LNEAALGIEALFELFLRDLKLKGEQPVAVRYFALANTEPCEKASAKSPALAQRPNLNSEITNLKSKNLK